MTAADDNKAAKARYNRSRNRKRKERRKRNRAKEKKAVVTPAYSELEAVQVGHDTDDLGARPYDPRITARLRRTDDVRFHSLNNRLHVVETRVEYVVAVLAGQRDMTDDLMEEVRTNSRDISELRAEVSSTESNVLKAIATHAALDSKENAAGARTALWTLMAVLLTAAVSFGAYILDKLDHLGMI